MTDRAGRDPALRGPTVAVVLGGAAFLVLVLALVAAWWAGFSRAVIERDAALAGKLLSAEPGAASLIASAMGHPASVAEQDAGRALARRFGYDADLPPLLNPVLRASFLASLAGAVVLCAAAAAAAAFAVRAALGRVLRQVRAVSDAAQQVTAGRPLPALPVDDEGELSVLAHRLDDMAQRLLSALSQVQREREYLRDFLTDVSHQLKTPLASVRMYTDLAAEPGAEGGADRGAFLERSQGQLDRMEWLIANLLSVARMEAGAVPFDVRPAPLGPTVERALEGVRPLAENRSVRVRASGEMQACAPHDVRWLAEALSNIVKNCVEHSPTGGLVSVRVESSAVVARVVVEDQGDGIPAAELPRIFDRFAQPRPGGTGTGVGLALARAIVERHRGLVAVESAQGMGTRFTVTLHTREI